MKKLKDIKNYFKDTRLEKAFLKLLAYKKRYKMSLLVAFYNDNYISDTEMALLSLFYNANSLDHLCELIDKDIQYILEG